MQFFDPGRRHFVHRGEIQLPQMGQTLEMFQAGVGDRRVVEVESLEPLEALEVFERVVVDLTTVEVEIE